MAILSGGPNSGFSGKAGSVVGYYRLGKWVIRGLPKLSAKNKKGSADQNFHRGRLKAIQQFLSPIIPFIRVGFNLEARQRGNTAHNSATSWNMLHAFAEDGRLDYSKVRVSLGSLEGPEAPKATIEGDHLVLTWIDNSEGRQSRTRKPSESDQAMFVVVDISGKYADMRLSGARRSACRDTMKLLSDMDGCHVWMSFISDDRLSISNSEYLGIIAR